MESLFAIQLQLKKEIFIIITLLLLQQSLLLPIYPSQRLNGHKHSSVDGYIHLTAKSSFKLVFWAVVIVDPDLARFSRMNRKPTNAHLGASESSWMLSPRPLPLQSWTFSKTVGDLRLYPDLSTDWLLCRGWRPQKSTRCVCSFLP